MEFKTKPYKHQYRALELSEGKRAFAYLMDTGTGKTKVAIDDAARAFRRGEIDTLLVFAPNGVHRDWVSVEEGIGKHLPDDIPRASGFYSSGYLRRDFRDAMQAPPTVLKVLALNIETLSRGQGYEIAKELVQKNKVFTVVDEGQRFKRPRSKRTRNGWHIGQASEYTRLLSGSVLTKGWEDFYGQYRFLDWKILGFKTNAEFKAAHCNLAGQYNTIVGYRDVDKLLDKIGPYTYQVLLEDCIDMPPQTAVRRTIELSAEQLQLYKKMKRDFMVEVQKGEILHAAQAITRLIRLQQILHGFLPLEAGGIRELPCPRFDAAVDILSGFHGKAIIWARFQNDVRRLQRELTKEGIGNVIYYGGLGESDREANLVRWRKDPGLQAIIATPQTLGEGRTLNEATGCCFFGHSFNYDHRKQARGRNYRIGQTKPTILWDFVAPGTLDEKILVKHTKVEDAIKVLTDRRELLYLLGEEDSGNDSEPLDL